MKTITNQWKPASWLAALLLCTFWAGAQNVTVVASGFVGIGGLSYDNFGNVWVAENGTGTNDGKISVVTPDGKLYAAVTNLPSFLVDTMTGESSGPARAYRNANQLHVMVGGGADANAGSLLTFDLSSYTPGDVPFTVAQATHAVHISDYVYSKGFKDSNPFRVSWDANGDAFIADAGANAVLRYSALGDSLSVVHVFPPIPNTFTPFPPFIDYVPTCIAPNPAGGHFVGNLTGFPFVPGLSKVVSVDNAGNLSAYADNLTLSVEMQLDAATGDLYVLQFGVFDSTFAPVFNSARIIRIKPTGERSVFATGFGPSAGMALDGKGGVYVAHLFTGQVLHISPLSAVQEKPAGPGLLSVWPNPVETDATVQFDLPENTTVHYAIFNAGGIRQRDGVWDRLPAGKNSVRLPLTDLPAGICYLSVWTNRGSQTVSLFKK